jgi:hypothetical protein
MTLWDKTVSDNATARAPAAPSETCLTIPAARATQAWKKLFQQDDSDRHQELLALAARQGALYLQQVPKDNGHAVAPPACSVGNPLHIRPADWPRIRPEAMAVVDQELDWCQRQAVARALATPDLCLVAGHPRTGKARVAVEIITQAALRGERVLLVATATAAIDRVLAQIADREGLYPLRWLDAAEVAAHLPVEIQGMTQVERLRALRVTLPLVLSGKDQAEERCRRRKEEEILWPTIVHLTQRKVELDQRLAACRQRRDEIVQNVRARAAARIAELRRELETLAPLVRARETGRWWSRNWWRAMFHRDVCRRKKSIDEQLAQAQAEMDGVEKDLGETEMGRRLQECRQEEIDLEQSQGALAEEWKNLIARIDTVTLRPEAMTLEAVKASQERWLVQFREDEEACRFTRHWAQHLRALIDGLPGSANPLAATISAVAGRITSDLFFDLAIVLDAHQTSEADYLELARRARRIVLIGELRDDGPAVNVSKAPYFLRLWSHLHAAPQRLPYSWSADNGKLCCRLRSLAAGQRKCLQREPVADFPEIELRILSVPGTRPTLAQIVFPHTMSLPAAKQYVYKELQEIAIQSAGRNACLYEEGDRFHFRFQADARSMERVVLDDGIAEILDSEKRATIGLEFDKSSGWHRENVEAWLDQHVPLRDLGRTIYLETVYAGGVRSAR